MNQPSFLDRWDAFQSVMNDHGVVFQTINTLDVLSTVSGGVEQKTGVAGDIDLLLSLDGARLFNWKDSTFFFYGLGLYGDDPSRNAGDSQAVSSIAGPNTWKLYEAWYQVNFLQERFSFLAGLYDVTSEFDVILPASELFVHSSFGTGPEFAGSGRNGPSTFPSTSLAIRGQAILSDNILIRAVAADGVPGDPQDTDGTAIILREKDGVFVGTELAVYSFQNRQEPTPDDILKKRPFRLVFQRVGRAAPIQYEGKYALGLWGYTTALDDLNDVDSSGIPRTRKPTGGIYGLVEQIVYHETDDREQGLSLFARAGVADPRVNRFSQYYGGGMVYRGLIPGRDADLAGIGVAAAINGSHYKKSQRRAGTSVDDAEIALELSYAINVRQELVIQPDLQYIINPSTAPSISSALVVGVRLQVNVNWFEGPTTSVEIQK